MKRFFIYSLYTAIVQPKFLNYGRNIELEQYRGVLRQNETFWDARFLKIKNAILFKIYIRIWDRGIYVRIFHN